MSSQDVELANRFWNELREHRTGMLGLADARSGHCQPMTAFFDDLPGPLWFFTPTSGRLAQGIEGQTLGLFNFVASGHRLYACVHGQLTLTSDPKDIEHFWSDEVAKWFGDAKGGAVSMLRFEPGEAEIWEPANYARLSKVDLGAAA